MIIDTSVVLAVFFNEKYGAWAADKLEHYKTEAKMSVVNLSECLILIKDRQPRDFEDLKERLVNGPIEFVSPSTVQAVIAAEARLKYSKLNLGDCFAYALAKDLKDAILSLDIAFKRTDIKTILPL